MLSPSKHELFNLHGPGNVDMGPTERRVVFASSRLDAIDKRLQEQRSGATAAGPATRLECSLCQERHTILKRAKSYVAQISVRRMDLWAKILIEGQSPESVVLGLPGDA